MKRHSLILLVATTALFSAAVVGLFAQRIHDPGAHLRDLSFEEDPRVLSKLVAWLPQARRAAHLDTTIERFTADLAAGSEADIRYRFEELLRDTSPQYLLPLLVDFIEHREALRQESGRRNPSDRIGKTVGFVSAPGGMDQEGGGLGSGECPEGTTRHPYTGECVTQGQLMLLCKREPNAEGCPKVKSCPPGQEYSPVADMCLQSNTPGNDGGAGGSGGGSDGGDAEDDASVLTQGCPLLKELVRLCEEEYLTDCVSSSPNRSSEECRELGELCNSYRQDAIKEGCSLD